MVLNSPSETPSVEHTSVGPLTKRELQSLTAVKQNSLGKLAHLSLVSLEHMLTFAQKLPFSCRSGDKSTYHTHILNIFDEFPVRRLYLDP
jgi:hypothetical protein